MKISAWAEATTPTHAKAMATRRSLVGGDDGCTGTSRHGRERVRNPGLRIFIWIKFGWAGRIGRRIKADARSPTGGRRSSASDLYQKLPEGVILHVSNRGLCVPFAKKIRPGRPHRGSTGALGGCPSVVPGGTSGQPGGRKRIPQRFIAGWGWHERHESRQGRKNDPSGRDPLFRPCRDSAPNRAGYPAMNRWAFFGRPWRDWAVVPGGTLGQPGGRKKIAQRFIAGVGNGASVTSPVRDERIQLQIAGHRPDPSGRSHGLGYCKSVSVNSMPCFLRKTSNSS